MREELTSGACVCRVSCNESATPFAWLCSVSSADMIEEPPPRSEEASPPRKEEAPPNQLDAAAGLAAAAAGFLLVLLSQLSNSSADIADAAA